MGFPTTTEPIATWLLMAATVAFSIWGFTNRLVEEKYIFCPRWILADKQYYRLVSSAFLHADLRHLLFNMLSLYCFGPTIEWMCGPGQLLLIYFAAVIGGNLLSLWLHRHHEYFAYGASGGVCGLVFAYIAMFPTGGIGMFFLPFYVPAWAYGIGFLVVSFFALKAKRDNIGHDAHLGGAIIGLITATAFHPSVVQQSPITFAALMTVSVALFVYFLKNPMFLPLSSFVDRSSSSKRKSATSLAGSSREVDRILDKISQQGIHSLTSSERAILDSMSSKLQSRAQSKGRESDLVI